MRYAVIPVLREVKEFVEGLNLDENGQGFATHRERRDAQYEALQLILKLYNANFGERS